MADNHSPTEHADHDADAYVHATRLWTLTLEISVLMAQFPSAEIAQRSHDFRTLGLGYANIGGLLMNLGLGYDSDKGRALCGALTALMTEISRQLELHFPSMGPALAEYRRAARAGERRGHRRRHRHQAARCPGHP